MKRPLGYEGKFGHEAASQTNEGQPVANPRSFPCADGLDHAVGNPSGTLANPRTCASPRGIDFDDLRTMTLLRSAIGPSCGDGADLLR